MEDVTALFSLIGGKFKAWLATAGAFVIVIAFAFLKGRSEGKAAAQAQQAKANAKSINAAKEVEDDVQGISDDDVRRRLSGWMRDGKR